MMARSSVNQGRASNIIDTGDGTILRIGGRPMAEAAIMEVALAHGFPVPRVVEVRDDGLVLEWIDGPTMGRHLGRRPWLMRRQAGVLAELHRQLHEIPFEGRSLVHFDLHPDNVLLSTRGPVVIDWTNAHAGDADADLAMTWLILDTSSGLPGRLMARLFAAAAGADAIDRGLDRAREFRIADPNVTHAERARAQRAAVRRRNP
jgi:aminoglycoside phosphotransferase (APT) family kinase protein